MFEKDSEEYAKSRINENCSGSNMYRRIRKAYKDGADRGYGVGRWNYPNDGDPSKEALEYAGIVHRYRDSYGETEQMHDVADAYSEGYRQAEGRLNRAKEIIAKYLSMGNMWNSDEYWKLRSQAEQFLGVEECST